MVVSDTGPILNLAYAEYLWPLPTLFGEVPIPLLDETLRKTDLVAVALG